jgi:hypothetical protein
MNVYYIQSGWRSGIVIARNNLQAMEVAIETKLHKIGRTYTCLRVDKNSCGKEILELIHCGPARILPASIFRSKTVAVKPN